MTRAERFWSKVDSRDETNACWPWLASIFTQTGYGQFRDGNTSKTASSVAFELSGGKLLPGEEVCHTCDNRLCCNPGHLFAGTRKANMQDAASKGRVYRGGANHPVRGENNGQSKLTDNDVLAIRSKGETMSQKQIAEQYKVSRGLVSRIIAGSRWTHLKGGV